MKKKVFLIIFSILLLGLIFTGCSKADQQKDKIEAGAEFIQTQAVYDLDNFKKFMDYARQFPVKILAGIILLTSAPMARFMNKNVAGVVVPQGLIDELEAAPKGRKLEKGVEIAGRMIRRIKEEKMCDGVHIMAIGKEEVVPDIMSIAGL